MKKCDDCTQTHPDHSKQISRLNRINGQIDGVKKMIENKRYCPEIIIQLKAITSAVKSLEAKILEEHLSACVNDAFNSKDKKEKQRKIDELVELFSRY